jgi:hypothetical protein
MADNINILNVGTRDGVASEATLSALLATFRANSKLSDKQLKALDKLNKGYTPGSGKDPNVTTKKSLTGLSDAANVLEGSLKGVPRQFEIFGDMLERGAQKPVEVLGNSLKNVGNAAENLAGKLPLWLGGPIFAATIGVVTTSFGMLAGYLQNSLDAFQDLSTYGGNFGNDLIALRKSALMGNLSLEEFGALVKENSVLFSVIGGNVSDGATAFSKLSLKVREFETKRLRGLGYTVADVNEMLADYLDVASKSSDIQGDLANNQDKVVAGAVKFGTELNELSSITGLSRKQISKEIKEISERGELLGALSTAQKKSTEDVGNKFRSLIAAVTPFGKTATNAAADLISFGGAFRTKESRALLVAAPQFAKTLRSYTQAVTNNAPPEDIGDSFGDMVVGLMNDLPRLRAFARAGNQEAANILSQNAAIINKYEPVLKQGEQVFWNQLEIDKKKAVEQGKVGQALAKLDEVFRKITSKIQTTIINSTIFNDMMKLFDKFVNWMEGPEFDGFINSATDMFSGLLETFNNGIKWLGNIFTEEGRTKMWADVTKIFNDFFSKDNAEAMWKSITATLDPVFKTLQGVISTGILEGFNLIRDSIFGARTQPLTTEQQEKQSNVKNYQTNLTGVTTPGTAANMESTMDINRMIGNSTDNLPAPNFESRTDNLPAPNFESRASGGGTGRGGLFRLHANEYVLNQDMIKDLNMSFDRMSLAAADRSSLYSTTNVDTTTAERVKTITDFPKAEQEQFQINLDSKNILQDLKDNNEEMINLFRRQLEYQEQQTRDISDMLDFFEKNA